MIRGGECQYSEAIKTKCQWIRKGWRWNKVLWRWRYPLVVTNKGNKQEKKILSIEVLKFKARVARQTKNPIEIQYSFCISDEQSSGISKSGGVFVAPRGFGYFRSGCKGKCFAIKFECVLHVCVGRKSICYWQYRWRWARRRYMTMNFPCPTHGFRINFIPRVISTAATVTHRPTECDSHRQQQIHTQT